MDLGNGIITGTVESYLRRAFNKLDEAKYHLERFNYPESISASQEAIEFSVKAIFLLYGEEYSRKHKFREEEFSKLLRSGTKDLARVFLLSEFWSKFYTVAKYGYEKLEAGPEHLFKREEAELALKHAEECFSHAQTLKTQKELLEKEMTAPHRDKP